MKKKIVILTGAGISAESGIATFRDSNGLWEGHNVMDVATPQGWQKNKELVLDFYNQRRKNANEVLPNKGHLALVELEKYFNVSIITQNVDNLHEKAGSRNIIHLHGEIFKSRSTFDPNLIYDIEGWELNIGDKCEKGSQLRPHIVWFGEAVPMIEDAILLTKEADIFIVIGTSLQVYPAANLLDMVQTRKPIYVIDPNVMSFDTDREIIKISEKGSIGVPQLVKELICSL